MARNPVYLPSKELAVFSGRPDDERENRFGHLPVFSESFVSAVRGVRIHYSAFSWSLRKLTNRYPTPRSVNIYFGLEGSSSNFFLR